MKYNPLGSKRDQATLFFLTFERMGEAKYPSSLSYLADKLYTFLKILRGDIATDNRYQTLPNSDRFY